MTDLTAARQLADLYSDCGARDDDLVAATIRALASEVERLRAAIGFYADPETYETQYEPKGCGCCTDIFEPINDDKGDIARAALQEKTNGME